MTGVVEHQHEGPEEMDEQRQVQRGQPPVKPARDEERDARGNDRHAHDTHEDHKRNVAAIVDEPHGQALAEARSFCGLVNRIADSNGHGQWRFYDRSVAGASTTRA